MIDVQPKQLNEYLKMLQSYEAFSISRIWDGEMLCIVGKEGKNCDSCDYLPELRDALRVTITSNKPYFHALYFPMYHNGTKNLRRSFEEYLFSVQSKVVWYDAMIFQRAFESGSFYCVIRALRARKVVLVACKKLASVGDLVPLHDFIEIPEINAFKDRVEIEKKICELTTHNNDLVFIFCAGMASNVIIDDLYGINATMIDMGSVWDACLSFNTRQWMRKIPDHVVRRNIYGV